MPEPSPKPVTWNRIKRYFTGIDIAFMKMYGYHLDDSIKVAQEAGTLLGRLADGSMPPKPFKSWTKEMLDDFHAWIDGGFQEYDQEIYEREKPFIELSQFLTGFDDLEIDPELAEEYHQRLVQYEKVDNDILMELIENFKSNDVSHFENIYLLGSESEELRYGPRRKYQEVAKILIILWYTAAFFDPDSGFPIKEEAGTSGQYTSGLVWRAIEAHPMGYSTEGFLNQDGQFSLDEGSKPYWHFKPNSDGMHTGLG